MSEDYEAAGVSDHATCSPFPHFSHITACQRLNVVVVALHWGLHYVRAKLAMYQRTVAHAAIDAGADLIIGTHAHIPKGIEMYKGKAIFYSLGNFALDSNFRAWPDLTPGQKELVETYDIEIDPAWAKGYPYGGDARKTIAVTCVVSRHGIERVSFLPGTITMDARPRFLSRSEDAFDELVQYMKDVTAEAGLTVQYRIEGEEVVVS